MAPDPHSSSFHDLYSDELDDCRPPGHHTRSRIVRECSARRAERSAAYSHQRLPLRDCLCVTAGIHPASDAYLIAGTILHCSIDRTEDLQVSSPDTKIDLSDSARIQTVRRAGGVTAACQSKSTRHGENSCHHLNSPLLPLLTADHRSPRWS